MAVIKVFDAKGVKTVELMGNVSEQGYDSDIVQSIEDIEQESDEDTE